MERWTWWLRVTVAVAAAWRVANSDPQTYTLGTGCSTVNITKVTDFINNLNATFSDLRSQLVRGQRFATVGNQITSKGIYAMAQCRNYMAQLDCLACYDAAVSEIRTNCSNNVAGARAVFDGCFLRYESYDFYERTSEIWLECGNRSASDAAAFSEEGAKLLNDLQVATPRTTNVFFCASKRRIGNGITLNSTIYAVAQCALTISVAGCQGCLTTAAESLRIRCLRPASTEARVVDTACFIRYSNAPFFPDNQTTDLRPLLESSINEKAVIGGAVGGAGLLVILLNIFIWFKFSRKPRRALIGNILGATELQRPNRYSYRDLKAATNNFSEENKLGQGGFGAVYKATLKNETVVAVKKLDISNSRAKADFETEVRLISNVHHRNLVRLLGCCSKGSELLLVYEYMKNASLDRFLYGENRGTLNWKQRRDIIFGIARGVAYLHEDYHVTILHRDIKPSNILLDDEFQAKIADFGLARLLSESQSHVTTGFAGTLGYAAPEYAKHGHLSEKVDIYSFGIVILEIISGRKCSDVDVESTTEYLLREAWIQYERGTHGDLADSALGLNEEDEVEDLKKMVEIALLCVQSTPSSRPTMSQLILMILSDRSIGPRALIRRPSSTYGYGFQLSRNAASDATASITHFTSEQDPLFQSCVSSSISSIR